MTQWVYSFGAGRNEGRAGMRDLLGGKGANLAEMAAIGLPVPPGFTITTEVCTAFYKNDRRYPEALVEQVRAALIHVQRLHRARAAMAAGVAEQEAMRQLRPPVFIRRTGAFAAALRLWPETALAAASEGLFEAERACKRTGAPAETLCRNAIAALARRAARARKGK